MKRRLISLFLAIMMILTLFPTGVVYAVDTGDDNATITAETVIASPGTTVSLKLSIKGNPGLLGAKVNVVFDSGLTLLKAKNGEAFSALAMTPPGVLTSPCSFVWDATYLDAEDILDGTILTLTFQVSEEVKNGEKLGVYLTCRSNDFRDGDAHTVTVSCENGGVEVITYIPGDADGDFDVSVNDVIAVRRSLAGGYNITINEQAADVDADGDISTGDVIRLRRNLAGGYGKDGELYNSPLAGKHDHALDVVPAKEANCTVEGNIAHWYCPTCQKCFSDAIGLNEITLEETKTPVLGHTIVVDEAVPATYTSTGLTEGSHCSVCHEVIIEQEEVPMLKKDEANITYKLVNNDDYLAQQTIENPNPATYVIGEKLTLSNDIEVPGYTFLGWFDSFASNATQIKEIPATSTGNVTLYGHWEKTVYKVRLSDSINGDTTLNYTVDEGATLGKNPEWSGYVFMGWSDKAGEIVKSVPAGTTGNINLTANWTSERNKTVPVNKLGDPMILHDDVNGQILFTYEIGEIRNVPLYTIKDFLNVVAGGVTLTESITSSQSITEGTAEQIAETVSRATTDTSAWTLSDTWNKTTEESWDHMEEVGEDTMTSVTDYREQCIQRGQTPTYVIGSGNNTTYTAANGVVAMTENGEISGNTAVPLTSDTNYDLTDNASDDDFAWDFLSEDVVGLGVAGAGAIAALTFGAAPIVVAGALTGLAAAGIKSGIKWVRHEFFQKDTAKLQTTVASGSLYGTGEGGGFSAGGGEGGGGGGYGGRGGADDIVSTISTSAPQTTTYYMNTNAGYSLSNTTGHSETTSHLLHNLVRDTHHYGEIYSEGHEESKSESHAESVSDAREYGSTVTYSNAVTTTTTRTYSNEGAKSGYYRIVCAGTAHVFAVVGYDIASSNFYTYTYTVMDDETKEFLDYSKDGSFTDYENGILPFEVPGVVLEYVDILTRQSDGIIIDDETGTVVAYEPSDKAKSDTFVFIPTYASVTDAKGTKKAVKITNIADNIFRNNHSVKYVMLSCFNESIPDSAFENCSNLKFIVAANHTSIGNNAFAGCTNLEGFTVSDMVTSIGTNAFTGVESISVEAGNWDVVDSILNCKANNVKLTLPDAEAEQNVGRTIEIPSSFKSFDVIGKEGCVYKDLQIVSSAEKTGFYNLNIKNTGKIPVISRSANTLLNDIQLENTGVCLNLDSSATELSLFGANKLTSGNNRAAVVRSTNMNWYDPKVVGKLSMVGNLYVWGNLTGTRTLTDYLTFNPGEVIQINEAQYYALLNGTVVAFDANGGTCTETSREVDSGKAIGTLPTPTRTGYKFLGWFCDEQQYTADSVISNDITLTAKWEVLSYTATWDTGTGYNVVVERTASPNADAELKALSSGSEIYYGDVLKVTYTAATNYTVTSNGKTDITVTGDITKADIYATAKSNEVFIGYCNKTEPLTTNTVLSYYVEYYKVGRQIRVKGWVYDPSNTVPVLNLYGGWNSDTSHEGFYTNQFDIGTANKSNISFAVTSIPSAAQGHMFDFLLPVELSNGCRIAVQTAYTNEGGFAVKIADSVVFTGNTGIVF